ncbi:hypothetical protein HNQ60_000217 [Povalibacter uvarum]|uniref:Bacterial Pleckstrin homology domain-containing protein n=1 Tax=Povalibacter uvarum TaxID=732238 RepID=A0A841HE35_9GAMM|nr:PH domain-containing protein [Povalibacter uvarum]MBB6091371.1 hypothetical protein [Povalibacter uvarum]
MMQQIEFGAPWGKVLKTATVLTVGLIFVVTAGILVFGGSEPVVKIVAVSVPAIILVAALFFTVRGYVLTQDAIFVKRLVWRTRLTLDGLHSVTGDAHAMQGAFRVFGNGGLFSFSGEFWNRKLGRFRALATDPSRAIVLRYPQRTIVITPHDPQQFIMRARTLIKTRDFPV